MLHNESQKGQYMSIYRAIINSYDALGPLEQLECIFENSTAESLITLWTSGVQPGIFNAPLGEI